MFGPGVGLGVGVGFGFGFGGVATWSLASIEATPRLFVIVAFTESPMLTVKSSIDSETASSSTVTAIDFVFSPGANVSVPTRAT